VASVFALEVPTLVLDSEVAVFDRQLVSRFEGIRGRTRDNTATPALGMAFDCLFARGSAQPALLTPLGARIAPGEFSPARSGDARCAR
jgi:ATP-dependent DNA ligase